TLLNPSLRFAYDRFGPVITTVTRPQLKTIRDYVYAGLRAKVPQYASNALLLVLLNATVLPRWGQFWRYFGVAILALQNQQQALHLTHTASRVDAEASQMLQLGLAPFKGDGPKTGILREEMKQGLMMGVIRNSDQEK
ncbi:hypothetical protein DV735_g5965, partial [Chaetothyriales sp. CBS 134920]